MGFNAHVTAYIEPAPLSDFSNLLREMGPAKFGRLYGTPVLISVAPLESNSKRGFSTETLQRKEKPARPTLPELSAVNDQSAVIPIVKKPGSPYPDRIGIGRTRTADISLPFDGISKYHAYITRDGDSCAIVDAGSTNGTQLETKRLKKGKPAPLTNGARVCFGEHGFIYLDPAGFLEQLGRKALFVLR